MRFVRLVVDHFRGIEHAEVELGRGLNVLYGPNDLGKSSLAAAVRAALLLPHTSAAAEEHVPWRGEYEPEVELTFVDADERFWRVSKTFGSRGSSFLESSKDGRDFVGEAKGREVDERLRAMLSWGAPPPGGKAGVRGLPETFLSNVLLAEQTNVDAILSESLEMDSDPGESGRLRLTRALQGLARDPRFKKLLDAAEAECEQHFSPTGRFRRGKSTPLFKVAEEVKKLQSELDAVDGQLRLTDEVESRLKQLRARVQEIGEESRAAARTLELARQVAAADSALEAARAELARIVEARARVAEKESALSALAESASASEAALATAREAESAGRTAFDAAKDAHLAAASQKAASQRAVKTAELQQALAALESERLALDARQRAAEQARAEAARASQLAAQQKALADKASAARERLDADGRALEDTRLQREQLRNLLAFGAFRDAAAAVAALETSRRDAAAFRSRAEDAGREAQTLRATVAEEPLPDAETANAIRQLERDLEVAEAALGGGLSATITPLSKSADVRVRVDGGEEKAAEGTVEASRALELVIGEIARVRILAGDAAKRQRAEALRARWNAEARPVLTLAGLESGAALSDARARADESLRKAEALEKDARQLLERAAEAEARLVDAPKLERRAKELEAALEGKDRDALAAIVKKVGPAWETQTERAAKTLEAGEAAGKARLDTARAELAGLDGQLVQVASSVEAAQKEADRVRAALGEDPAECLKVVAAEGATLSARDAALRKELGELEGAAGKAVLTAKARMEEAEAALARAVAGTREAEETVAAARSARDQARGELEAARAHADSLPFARVEEAAREREKERAALPASVPDLATAEAAAARLAEEHLARRGEFQQAEGELIRVGGAVARERHAALKAGQTQKVEEQKALERDAEAWKLLRDTLKDCEAEGAQHIGKALAGEVAERFTALTGSRYGALAMDPNLKVENIEAGGAPRAVDALSAGTRDQLATLLRLAIAERLGSAIILDDQLVHSDRMKLEWFHEALSRAATMIQVVVLTCRREDYESDVLAKGRHEAIDLTKKVRRLG